MSVYSSSVYDYRYNEAKTVSLEQLDRFIQESNEFVFNLFNENSLFGIMEAEAALTLNTNKVEETKKSIIQRIKELFSKFIGFVKGAFVKLADKLQEVYNKTNFVDKFVARYKNIVIWENVEKLKEAGWKGMPTSTPMVGTPVSIKDTLLFDLESQKQLEEFEKYYNQIITSNSSDDAKQVYNTFSKRLKEYKERISEDNYSRMSWYKNIEINFANIDLRFGTLTMTPDEYEKLLNSRYFAISNVSEDEKTYFPIKNYFTTTKYMAENGQKLIRDVRQFGKKMISALKVDKKESELTNMKSYKKGGSNYNENDKEENIINMLYYKAKYEYASVFISLSQKMTSLVLSIMKNQHKHAIKFYMSIVSAINKYLPEVAKSK